MKRSPPISTPFPYTTLFESPYPVPTPSAGASTLSIPNAVARWVKNRSSSTKVPGSSSSESRSRAVSLPAACWRATRSPPPPSSNRARRTASSSCRLGRRSVTRSSDPRGRPAGPDRDDGMLVEEFGPAPGVHEQGVGADVPEHGVGDFVAVAAADMHGGPRLEQSQVEPLLAGLAPRSGGRVPRPGGIVCHHRGPSLLLRPDLLR